MTVFFRWLLLIPHYFVLYFLGLAAAVVAFIGWWGALFTGRLPEFAAAYLTGFIRWYARVQAYAMLLTDTYPPFSLDDDPGYPVRIAVPPRDTLNRGAVFFRFILVFPASVLNSLVVFGGTTIVGFIAWLIALVSGQLPTSLHQAYTAILRYTTRVNSYFYMLTPAYPVGLFGDGPPVPAGYGVPAPPWPADWRLFLTRGARQLIGWFIGIGVLFWVGWVIALSVLAASSGNAIVTGNAIDTMNTANNTLTTEVNGWQGTVQSCGTDVACVTKADASAATFFTKFASTLKTTPMPPRAVAAANQLYADATKIARDLTQLSTATSGAQYQTIAASSGLDATLNQFGTDNNALGTALDNS